MGLLSFDDNVLDVYCRIRNDLLNSGRPEDRDRVDAVHAEDGLSFVAGLETITRDQMSVELPVA